jgi:acetolactate synthase I/III small subunit
MEKEFTLLVNTENNIGLLNHLSIVFTRRKLNIESLTVSESKIKDIFSFTIVIKTRRDIIERAAKQLENIIGVIKVFVYENDEIIHQELAMYKLPISAIEKGLKIEEVVRRHNARVLNIENDYILIEKTGHKADTQKLMEELKPYGILQFIRTGRIAMAKPMKDLEIHIREKKEAYEIVED